MSRLVFVVEDDHDIASLVKFNLENAGFQVRVFSGGAGMLATAEKSPPAVFLLDIMLPDGDGLELCRVIRRSAALTGASIIFLTAKAEEIRVGDHSYGTDPGSGKVAFPERDSGVYCRSFLNGCSDSRLQSIIHCCY